MTIPIAFRKKFGLNKAQKAIIRADGDRVVLESIPEIESFRGIFKPKKKMTWKEERKALDEAWAHGKI